MDLKVQYQTSATLNQSELQFKSSANVMRFMKRDHKSANVNLEIVKYVVDDCLTNILKKSRLKSAKIAELGYFEIGCKKTVF